MMSIDKTVSEHYRHGDLLGAIHTSLADLGKTTKTVTVEDLAPVDEFHIGGRMASDYFLGQLNFAEHDHVLDVGCGLGGAARYVAVTYRSQVTGIDLTSEYVETGRTLCAWVKLDEHITLLQGSALAMPFEEETFDGAYMMHVGMNIEAKAKLFAEIYRVLKPDSVFGIYDVMRISEGELTYPVPWAAKSSMSYLATPEQYQRALCEAGFEVSKTNNRHGFAVDFFRELREKTESHGGTPPLGLHTLMKETTAMKVKNMVDGITSNYIAPVEIIAHKYLGA